MKKVISAVAAHIAMTLISKALATALQEWLSANLDRSTGRSRGLAARQGTMAIAEVRTVAMAVRPTPKK